MDGTTVTKRTQLMGGWYNCYKVDCEVKGRWYNLQRGLVITGWYNYYKEDCQLMEGWYNCYKDIRLWVNGTTVKKKTVRLWVNGTNDTKRTVSLWVDGTTVTKRTGNLWVDGTTVKEDCQMVQLLQRGCQLMDGWYNCNREQSIHIPVYNKYNSQSILSEVSNIYKNKWLPFW